MDEQLEVIAETKYLRLVRRGDWEFIQRSNATGVVLIVPLTDNDNLLFIEQYRPPVDSRVIEFPAGLAGDIPDAPDEALEAAARRELLEETGYDASEIKQVFSGPSSAGLTDEKTTFFIARGLSKVGPGGGDASEDITNHEIPRAQADNWLQAKTDEGCLVGARIYTGLYLLNRELNC